jgi:hypothetical protein
MGELGDNLVALERLDILRELGVGLKSASN